MSIRNARPLVAVLALAWLSGAQPSGQSQRGELQRALEAMRGPVAFPEEALRAKSALERRSDKIDPSLILLADDVNAKGFGDFESKAAELGVPAEGRRVMVTLVAEDERDVQRLRREAEARGAQVQATFDNAVYASMPPTQIESLGRVDVLEYALPQAIFKPSLQAPGPAGIKTEGLVTTKISHLHKANIRGRGVKVGIIDFGFKGLARAIAAGEIPKPKAVKAFDPSGDMEARTVHGTACAEIIHDMAPDAELFLASQRGQEGEIVAATQWLVQQGVHIISFSGGGHFGPHNGTSTLDRLVNATVRDHNILWVNAAGNEGAKHFGGLGSDKDRDGVLEFDNGYNGVALQGARGGIDLMISWEDWGESPSTPTPSQDIDAFLFALDAQGNPRLVAQSVNPQNGRGRPMEFISLETPDPNQVFVLKLRASRITRPVRVHIFEDGGARMEPKDALRTVGLPATAADALAVGAVDVRNGRLEPFSSQGPTEDDRQKPEVSAPDNNITFAYREDDPEGRFPGTSAACPHVSGFAALLKQLHAAAKAGDLKKLVIKHVRDLGPSGFDPGYGHGHIDGSNVPTAMPADTGAGGAGEFPEEFGDALSNGDFERVWQLARRQPSESLRVVTGSPEYGVGDGLKVGIRSDRSCHFMLLHRSSDGEFTILSSSAERGPLKAGERYALPEGETWKVQPPVGRDGVMLVCSARPVDLADWLRRPDDSVSLATATFEVKR